MNWRQCRSLSSADSFVDVLLSEKGILKMRCPHFKVMHINALQVDGLHYHTYVVTYILSLAWSLKSIHCSELTFKHSQEGVTTSLAAIYSV